MSSPRHTVPLQPPLPPVPPDAAAVLACWFGAVEPAGDHPRTEWFRKDPAFDERIRARFGGLIEAALVGELDGWTVQPSAALARLLLLDQFTRNVFRGSPRACAGDARALAGAQALVASGGDLRLGPLRRVFVYLPFEHAEDRVAQAESLRLFGALVQAEPALAGYEDYARRHAEVIGRFGRFPHRNAILGRSSTPEEAEFLQQPGSSF
ncbi:DUF924 family protein [Sphaerotilus microaerophilus]|uniref:DUF924 family protein n=1 Tax=Sphaerotilus microaerophilus TaxID=2914710 RepID=UPI0020739763|nr:DUF924 family protein [Sphaerotilus sp. FB-5]